jgi:formamidopyrimidine-DNA glycosylase
VHWKDRRALIYSLFVDSQAIDGLKDEPKYDLIANELKKGKSSADISTMLNSENNRLADSKRKNEILLADKQSELAGFANIDYASIETELASIEAEITEEQARIDGLDKESKKAELEIKLRHLEVDLGVARGQDNIKKTNLERKIGSIEINVDFIKEKGEQLEKDIQWATDVYKSEKAKVFDERDGYCPHCHRLYETDKIEQIKKNWEEKHEETLTALKRKVLSIKKEYEWDKEYYTNKLAELENAKQELADFKPNPKIAELETEIATLQAELEKCETNEIDTSHLDELKSRRNFLIVELGKKDSHDKLKAKIASLYAEQRELVNAEIVLAKKRQQLEQYTLDIISLVNDSINSHFDGVKFKLFEELTATAQRNIKECCTITHNGIEYQSCSTGEKALVNLIIVSTLQNKLGTKLCLFADDASILNIPNPPDTQIVYLVNQKGKKLDCVKISDLY